jgi:hypothetical protein
VFYYFVVLFYYFVVLFYYFVVNPNLSLFNFNQALELDSTDLSTCFHLAECALAVGDFSVAQIALEKCLSINPHYLLARDKLVDVTVMC